MLQVPSGTFAADFTFQANYLDLDVDATPSVAPSNDPVDTYSWSWGDGTAAATTKVASHTYVQAGTYNVALTTKTIETGRSSTSTQALTITAPPTTANYFVASKDLLKVAFTPSIQDGTSYAWTFGDGGTSTDKAPVYTFALPGTYSVTLTVSGTQTVTQSVTVVDVYKPLRRLVDNLRLEVAIPPAAGTIYNRIKNPDGTKGAWGYQTPLAGSTIVGSLTVTRPEDHGISGSKLIYASSGTGTQVAYTTPVLATAGQYAAAQLVCPYVDGFYRAVVEALNASGAVVGTGTQTGFLGALGTAQRTPGYLLPTGTTKARIRLNHYAAATGTTPAAGKHFLFRRVMLAYASTLAAVDAVPYAESENWQNVISTATSVRVGREALNVGTLSATIADSSLDPATSSAIRPGQAVRLRVTTPDESGQTVVESIYNGTLNKAEVSYVGKARVTPKSTRIVLSATDNLTRLAQVGESRGVATIGELPELLEPVGIPYEINGSSGQTPAVQIISANDNASTLDQVSITRDTSGGYAYVNKHNVLVAKDTANMPSIAAGTVDEGHYSAVDATFSTENCINAVTIVWLRYTPASGSTPASTVEIEYGPYTDAASIDQWGYRPATFTMQGLENPTAIAAKAQAILTANATPIRHINNVLLPIRNVEDLTKGKALLDLYDLVQLGYARTATNELARVTGISHEIDPITGWKMRLVFGVNGNVAPPQDTPSPPSAASTGGGSTGSPATYTSPLSINASNQVSLGIGAGLAVAGGLLTAPAITRTLGNWSAACTTALTATATVTDLAGATVSVPVVAGDVFLVMWSADIQKAAAATTTNGIVDLNVAGAVPAAAPRAIFRQDAAAIARGIVGQSHIVSGLAAGTVVFKLQASGVGYVINAAHTTIRVVKLNF